MTPSPLVRKMFVLNKLPSPLTADFFYGWPLIICKKLNIGMYQNTIKLKMHGHCILFIYTGMHIISNDMVYMGIWAILHYIPCCFCAS